MPSRSSRVVKLKIILLFAFLTYFSIVKKNIIFSIILHENQNLRLFVMKTRANYTFKRQGRMTDLSSLQKELLRITQLTMTNTLFRAIFKFVTPTKSLL